MSRRQSGFALLIVLWSLSVLALLTAQLTFAGRTEAKVAFNVRANAILEAAADGGFNQGVFNLLQGAWPPDGAPHVVTIAGAAVEVRIQNEVNKFNPNYTSVPLMIALLEAVGVPGPKAESVSWAMVDWRTRGANPRPGGAKTPQYKAAGLDWGPSSRPFESTDELGLVLGMTPQIMQRLAPFISVYKEGDVDRTTAPAAAQNALDQAELSIPGSGGIGIKSPDLVARVTATAAAGRARFTRAAVVRMKQSVLPGEALYQVLTWETAGPDA